MKYDHLKLFKLFKKAGGQVAVADALGIRQSSLNEYFKRGLPHTAPGERSEHARIIAKLAKCTIREVLEASREISG